MADLILPWPPKELSPNARVHWAKRASAAKKYRKTCWALAIEADVGIDWPGEVHLWLTFCPHDHRHRDDDNLIAAFKSGRDGLADALGIDDKRFRVHPFLSVNEIVHGGAVKVCFSKGPDFGA